MKVNKGFKFRLYPTKEQQDKLQHCFFVYNQAYNIGLNLPKTNALKPLAFSYGDTRRNAFRR